MRLAAVLLTFVCLAACAVTPSTSEDDLARHDDTWRQRQATLDANAIMQGMARAREQAAEMARLSR